MADLYLFTRRFPYGSGEEFLEDEIVWVAKKFEHIYIVPAICSSEKVRQVPDNCVVIPDKNDYSRVRLNLLGLFDIRTIGFLTKDFFQGKVFLSIEKFWKWRETWMTLNQYLHQSRTSTLLKRIKKEDVCYSYWGNGWSYFFLLLKNKSKCIARFHGFGDLWEESYNGYIPLRTEYINRLDRAVLISKSGQAYFKKKYPNTETCVFPLGSNDYGIGPDTSSPDVLQVVSCSTIYPLKRVHLIFQALNNIKGREVEWTHIGKSKDAVYFNELNELINKEQNANLRINFLGHISHEEVLKYYSSHHFDVFVNLSTLEGVPVSIMEAESFGIPVVATDVGSTCDVMSKETGILVSDNPTVDEVTSAILHVSENQYAPRVFWKRNYDAPNNYMRFSVFLAELATKQ